MVTKNIYDPDLRLLRVHHFPSENDFKGSSFFLHIFSTFVCYYMEGSKLIRKGQK
ncbi:hypothetical protein GT23_4087 [Parageobacillus thermoglucosidasius]|nr:hypothetical protein GT23_4087 [Parageobacillus thermoglucosidasius]